MSQVTYANPIISKEFLCGFLWIATQQAAYVPYLATERPCSVCESLTVYYPFHMDLRKWGEPGFVPGYQAGSTLLHSKVDTSLIEVWSELK